LITVFSAYICTQIAINIKNQKFINMRNNYDFLKVMILALLFIITPMITFAQEGEEVKKTVPSFTPYWYLNGNIGFNQFYGDLNPDRYFQLLDQWKFAGGIYFGRQFSPTLGLRGQLLYAGLGAENTDAGKNMYMVGDLLEYNLNATLSFLNLFSRDKYSRKFDFYGFAGIGQFHARTNIRDIDTDARVGHVYPYGRVGYFGMGIDKRALFMSVPYGLGIAYSISEKLGLTLETSARYTGADELDSYVSDKNDQYGPTLLGITYRMYSAANLDKMAREFSTIDFTVTPEVLELHGDSVRLTVVGRVPEKYFHRKAAILFQPVVKYSTGETALKAINLLGEDVPGDGITISRDGGTFTYTDVFAYKPEMAVSELVITPLIFEPKEPVPAGATKESIIETSRYVNGPQIKLADGIIITPLRVLNDENVLFAPHGYEKETIISREAVIYFQVNLHNLNWNLALNRQEGAIQKIKELEEFLRQGWKIRDIEINGWASPEGEERFNEGLSERRSQTGLTYTHNLLRRLVRERNSLVKIDNVEKDITYKIQAHGEDWDGFLNAVRASNIPDRNIIINVVTSQPDVKQREQEIRNMTIVFKEIAEQILPPLRRVEIKVNAYEPKKTDAEIAQLATTEPSQLSEKELLFAATLTNDRDVQSTIYRSAINLYPNSYKGYNNAAVIELQRGDLRQAEEFLQKAVELGSGRAEVINNLGALEAKKKNFKVAENYFNDARRLGANVDYNLGILMITKGDYNNALSLFGTKSCNHNVALAQLLANNIAAANQNAKCAPEHAETFYLIAIIAARANDALAMIENLGKAIAADPALKAVAKDDREFLKFFDHDGFRALVQ